MRYEPLLTNPTHVYLLTIKSGVYEEHPNASICSDRQRFINAYLKLENQLSRSSQHHRPSLPLSFINPSCLTLNETCLSQNLQHTLLVPNSLSSQPAYGHLQQMYHHFKSGAAPPLRLLSTSDLTRPTISPVQLHNQMVGSQLIFNSITDPLVPGNVYESSRNSDNDAMRSKCKEQPELSKGRDERRRATHNEVERRRRDKINTWIMKLAKLVPQCSGDHSKYGQVSIT